jgi:putative oxidoreductase
MPTLTDRASRLRRLVHSVSSGLRWLPPTVARLTIGWTFLQTGWGKVNDLPKVIAYFTDLGIPAPQFQAPLAATAELVCGALILAGLFTRVASLPLIGTMLVAILTARPWSRTRPVRRARS